MRIVLICGGRNWDNYKKILKVLRREHEDVPIDFVIEGGQKSTHQGSWGEDSWRGHYGADYQGREAARTLGIQVVECPANWELHHKSAGPFRNQKQLDLALALAATNGPNAFDKDSLLVLAFHSDIENSKGTKDMINRAKKAGVKVKVIK